MDWAGGIRRGGEFIRHKSFLCLMNGENLFVKDVNHSNQRLSLEEFHEAGV
jgi:hypothetical protein